MTVDYRAQSEAFASFLMADATKGRRKRKGDKVEGRCPLPDHEDGDGSFGYFVNDDGWVCSCGRGKGSELRERLGWKHDGNGSSTAVAPARKTRPQRDPDAVHLYANSNRKLRWYNNDGTKTITWEHKEGERWVHGKNGDPGLYRKSAIAESDTVCLSESETDADAMTALGLTCVSTWAGAQTPLTPDQAAHFKGKSVFIFEHQDDPGRAFAENCTKVLRIAGVKAVTVRPPDGCKDIRDHLNSGGDIASVLVLMGKAHEALLAPLIGCFADASELLKIEDPPQEFACYPLLPMECLTILEGKPKGGKSCFALHLALCIAKGVWIGGRFDIPKARRVLFISWEDGPRRIKRRLKSYNDALGLGDIPPDRLFIHQKRPPTLWLNDPQACENLRTLIEYYKPEVLVLDTFSQLHTLQEKDSSDMTPVMATLNQMITDYKIACLLIHHARKPSGQGSAQEDSPSDAVRGSGAIAAAADCILEWGKRIPTNKTACRFISKDSDSDAFTVAYIPEGENVKWAIEDAEEGENRQLIREALMKAAQDLAIKGATEFKASDAQKALPRGTASLNTVRPELDFLVEKGRLTMRKDPGQTGAKWYSISSPSKPFGEH